jgi:hypothetical protein
MLPARAPALSVATRPRAAAVPATTYATAPAVLPATALVRGALLFIVADSLFGSFGTAFVFTQCGLQGVLAFMIGWQLVSTGSYIVNVYQFRAGGNFAARSYRGGIAGMMAAVMLTGSLMLAQQQGLVELGLYSTWWPVLLLGFVGGAARGAAFSSRTWLELNFTGGIQRQAYLSRTEALGTVMRLGLPLLAAGLLSLAHNNFGLFFVLLGGAGFAAVYLLFRTSVDAPPVAPENPWGLLLAPRYWLTAPFYIVDGAGHALRTGLFVSGAMAVIGSAASYGFVETGASACAAALLWLQSQRAATAPNLKTLRRCLSVMAIAWAALFSALCQPLLLPAFVAAYALSNPLITVIKSGLTLGGLAQTGAVPQDNLIARMVLLTLGRVGALSLALVVTCAMANPTAQLVGSCCLALALLPLDYLYSRRLASGR